MVKKEYVTCDNCGETGDVVLNVPKGILEAYGALVGTAVKIGKVTVTGDFEKMEEESIIDDLAENIKSVECENCGHRMKQFEDNLVVPKQ